MTKKQILLVEDDSNLREALSDTLKLNGYQVVMAEDGQQALLKLQNHTIDLILSDVQMQPMDGFELLRNLKQKNLQQDILLTGFLDCPNRSAKSKSANYL